ncbi:MAG: 1-phosphofructokinase [Anaerostipes sp.]|nr:1-phosphofructokinase [Anaerostipes sp.]
MIYTLTMNPAIDMNICSNELEAKKVNRTFDAVYTPNGKGLNVSFVLGHFGVASKIMGFFGGFSGKYIVEASEEKGFEVAPVWIDDTTRINVFLNDGSAEYKLVNEGSFINEQNKMELLDMIEKAEDMDYLSISGSLPQGIMPDFYDRVFEICQKKDVDVILDISSEKLADLLKYKPLLIKPNDEEVADIFGLEMKTEKDILEALSLLHTKGAQNILLTMGEKGAYFYNEKNVYASTSQPVKLLSSACAGDSALAAFLSVWLENRKNVEEAMKLSAATGANVAESNAIGTLEKVKEYKENIQVRKVK